MQHKVALFDGVKQMDLTSLPLLQHMCGLLTSGWRLSFGSGAGTVTLEVSLLSFCFVCVACQAKLSCPTDGSRSPSGCLGYQLLNMACREPAL